jgi:hypothetical protein
VQLLLELGADPNAGGSGATALGALAGLPPAPAAQIARLLLRHGADCLAPIYDESIECNLQSFKFQHTNGKPIAALTLAYLERQRAAGHLQLGSAVRAALLLHAVTGQGQPQLFSHALRCLEGHLAGARAQVAAAVQWQVMDSLLAAVHDRSSSSPAGLQELLASRLPFDLSGPGSKGRPPAVA